MDFPQVSIIILNWKGWRDTIECLESIYQNSYTKFNIILVDNYSQDESIDMIKKYCDGEMSINSSYITVSADNKPKRYIELIKQESERIVNFEAFQNQGLVIIRNDKNDGFAEGNNIGIRFAARVFKPEFMLIINNDTCIEKYLLIEMIKVTENYRNVGIVGPKSYHYDDPKILGCTGGKINFWTGHRFHLYAGQEDIGQFNIIEERDFISGTCMLINSGLTSSENTLDPKFFFGGGEDVDISLKAKEKGLKVISTPYAILWHKGESKKRLTLNKNRLQLYAYYYIRNNILLIKYHWRGIKLITVIICMPFTFINPLITFIKNGWSLSLLITPLIGVFDLLFKKLEK